MSDWLIRNGVGSDTLVDGGVHYDGYCRMSDSITVPQGDSIDLVRSVYDEDGDEVDLRTATEIVFVVSEGRDLAGMGMYPGGEVIIDKRLSTGGVSVLSSMYQYRVTINGDDTSDLRHTRNYYEARITMPGGKSYTTGHGLFISPATIIKDYVSGN